MPSYNQLSPLLIFAPFDLQRCFFLWDFSILLRTSLLTRFLFRVGCFLLVVAWLLPTEAIDYTALQATFQKLGGRSQTFTDWQNFIRDNSASPVKEKLDLVNQFFNRRVMFNSDLVIWGQEDYWATPMETLAKMRETAKILRSQSTSRSRRWAFLTSSCD